MPTNPPMILQLCLAALIGLAPYGMRSAFNAVCPTGAEYPLLTRLILVIEVPTSPGLIVGRCVIGALDGYGLVQDVDWSYNAHQWEHPPGNDGHPIGWRLAERIEGIAEVAGNMAIFAILWFMLRSKGKSSRRHRVAVVAITLWLGLMIPMAILGSLWMVL